MQRIRKTLVIPLTAGLATAGGYCHLKTWSSDSGSYLGRGYPIPFYEEIASPQFGQEVVFDWLTVTVNFVFFLACLLILVVVGKLAKAYYRRWGRRGLLTAGVITATLVLLHLSYHLFVVKQLEHCTFLYGSSDSLAFLSPKWDYPPIFYAKKEQPKLRWKTLDQASREATAIEVPACLASKLYGSIQFLWVDSTILNQESWLFNFHALAEEISNPYFRLTPTKIIKINHQVWPDVYCLATEANIGRLVTPLEPDQVLDYLAFQKDLERNSFILNEEDFEKYRCAPAREEITPSYTSVTEDAGGFRGNLVYGSIYGWKGIFQRQFTIDQDGMIKLEAEKVLLDCGKGIILY